MENITSDISNLGPSFDISAKSFDISAKVHSSLLMKKYKDHNYDKYCFLGYIRRLFNNKENKEYNNFSEDYLEHMAILFDDVQHLREDEVEDVHDEVEDVHDEIAEPVPKVENFINNPDLLEDSGFLNSSDIYII